MKTFKHTLTEDPSSPSPVDYTQPLGVFTRQDWFNKLVAPQNQAQWVQKMEAERAKHPEITSKYVLPDYSPESLKTPAVVYQGKNKPRDPEGAATAITKVFPTQAVLPGNTKPTMFRPVTVMSDTVSGNDLVTAFEKWKSGGKLTFDPYGINIMVHEIIGHLGQDPQKTVTSDARFERDHPSGDSRQSYSELPGYWVGIKAMNRAIGGPELAPDASDEDVNALVKRIQDWHTQKRLVVPPHLKQDLENIQKNPEYRQGFKLAKNKQTPETPGTNFETAVTEAVRVALHNALFETTL